MFNLPGKNIVAQNYDDLYYSSRSFSFLKSSGFFRNQSVLFAYLIDLHKVN